VWIASGHDRRAELFRTWPLELHAVIYADGEGAVLFWNRGAERIFGYTEGEAMGRPLEMIIPENLRQRHLAGYLSTMRTGETRYGASDTLAVPAVRKNGSRVSIEFTILPFRDDDGHMIGIAAVIRDVTERFEEMKRLRKEISAFRTKGGAS
jgi:PAS domain S-box-containing protein